MINPKTILAAFAALFLTGFGLSAPAAAAAAASEHEILHEGSWTKKSFRSAGTWTIYQEGDRTFVKLSADFRTRNAPDLKIFLSPTEAKKANGRNATNGSVLIAPLTSNAGEQVYEIPQSVDLASFKSILIHCQQFSKLWSAADLA